MDLARVPVAERLMVQKWNHDCPVEHGGTCPLDEEVVYLVDGVVVDSSTWKKAVDYINSIAEKNLNASDELRP